MRRADIAQEQENSKLQNQTEKKPTQILFAV